MEVFFVQVGKVLGIGQVDAALEQLDRQPGGVPARSFRLSGTADKQHLRPPRMVAPIRPATRQKQTTNNNKVPKGCDFHKMIFTGQN